MKIVTCSVVQIGSETYGPDMEIEQPDAEAGCLVESGQAVPASDAILVRLLRPRQTRPRELNGDYTLVTHSPGEKLPLCGPNAAAAIADGEAMRVPKALPHSVVTVGGVVGGKPPDGEADLAVAFKSVVIEAPELLALQEGGQEVGLRWRPPLRLRPAAYTLAAIGDLGVPPGHDPYAHAWQTQNLLVRRQLRRRGSANVKEVILHWHCKRAYTELVVEFFERLRSGAWIMRGIRPDDPSRRRQDIDPGFLSDSEVMIDLTKSEMAPIREAGPAGAKFREITVQSADATARKGRAPATIGAITNCRRWLEQRAAKGGPEKSKTAYWEEAKKKFPSLTTRRGLDRAWDQAVGNSPTWIKAGRKPSRSAPRN